MNRQFSFMRTGSVVLCVLGAVAACYAADPVTNEGLEPVGSSGGMRKLALTFVEYTNSAAFGVAASMPVATVGFGGYADGTVITTQYQGQDVTFTDGDDAIYSSASMEADGVGLDGNGSIGVSLSRSCVALGVRFPGALKMEIYDYQGGTLLYTTSDFAGSGSGHFGGVVSTVPFSYVVLTDWFDGTVYIDDLLVAMGDAWTGASDLGAGWRHLDWFGLFNVDFDPWIYHMQHGFMYPVGGTPYNLWFYTVDMGWLWTGSAEYPSLYSVNVGGWLTYQEGSSNPRWFYNWNTGLWETR